MPIAQARRSLRWAVRRPPFNCCRNSRRAAGRASLRRPTTNMPRSVGRRMGGRGGGRARCAGGGGSRHRRQSQQSRWPPSCADRICSRCCRASATSSSTRALLMPFRTFRSLRKRGGRGCWSCARSESFMVLPACGSASRSAMRMTSANSRRRQVHGRCRERRSRSAAAPCVTMPGPRRRQRGLRADCVRLDDMVQSQGWRLVGGAPLFRLYETADALAAQEKLARSQIWSRVFAKKPTWLRLGLPGSEAEWSRLAEVASALARAGLRRRDAFRCDRRGRRARSRLSRDRARHLPECRALRDTPCGNHPT